MDNGAGTPERPFRIPRKKNVTGPSTPPEQQNASCAMAGNGGHTPMQDTGAASPSCARLNDSMEVKPSPQSAATPLARRPKRKSEVPYRDSPSNNHPITPDPFKSSSVGVPKRFRDDSTPMRSMPSAQPPSSAARAECTEPSTEFDRIFMAMGRGDHTPAQHRERVREPESSAPIASTPTGIYSTLTRESLARHVQDDKMAYDFLRRESLMERLLGHKMVYGRLEPFTTMGYVKVDPLLERVKGHREFEEEDRFFDPLGPGPSSSAMKRGPRTPPFSPPTNHPEPFERGNPMDFRTDYRPDYRTDRVHPMDRVMERMERGNLADRVHPMDRVMERSQQQQQRRTPPMSHPHHAGGNSDQRPRGPRTPPGSPGPATPPPQMDMQQLERSGFLNEMSSLTGTTPAQLERVFGEDLKRAMGAVNKDVLLDTLKNALRSVGQKEQAAGTPSTIHGQSAMQQSGPEMTTPKKSGRGRASRVSSDSVKMELVSDCSMSPSPPAPEPSPPPPPPPMPPLGVPNVGLGPLAPPPPMPILSGTALPPPPFMLGPPPPFPLLAGGLLPPPPSMTIPFVEMLPTTVIKAPPPPPPAVPRSPSQAAATQPASQALGGATRPPVMDTSMPPPALSGGVHSQPPPPIVNRVDIPNMALPPPPMSHPSHPPPHFTANAPPPPHRETNTAIPPPQSGINAFSCQKDAAGSMVRLTIESSSSAATPGSEKKPPAVAPPTLNATFGSNPIERDEHKREQHPNQESNSMAPFVFPGMSDTSNAPPPPQFTPMPPPSTPSQSAQIHHQPAPNHQSTPIASKRDESWRSAPPKPFAPSAAFEGFSGGNAAPIGQQQPQREPRMEEIPSMMKMANRPQQDAPTSQNVTSTLLSALGLGGGAASNGHRPAQPPPSTMFGNSADGRMGDRLASGPLGSLEHCGPPPPFGAVNLDRGGNLNLGGPPNRDDHRGAGGGGVPGFPPGAPMPQQFMPNSMMRAGQLPMPPPPHVLFGPGGPLEGQSPAMLMGIRGGGGPHHPLGFGPGGPSFGAPFDRQSPDHPLHGDRGFGGGKPQQHKNFHGNRGGGGGGHSGGSRPGKSHQQPNQRRGGRGGGKGGKRKK